MSRYPWHTRSIPRDTLDERLRQTIYEYCRDYPETTAEDAAIWTQQALDEVPWCWERAQEALTDGDDTRADERREAAE